MYLFDTATQSSLEFIPAAQRVGMYVCGITPYDGGHLGHAFTYHTFDLVARRLSQQLNDVVVVRNITDVDDDMLRIARERSRDYREIADEQVAEFERDMAALQLRPVSASPRASESIEAIVALVSEIVAGGAGYVVDGWVYFEISRFVRYGQLSRLDGTSMLELARERGGNPGDMRKRSPLDFVLWQPSLPDEPHWQSPWGPGRPGWHIECSAMARQHLGLPVDIHGGGEDLIYPHHESEIAQIEFATGEPFCRQWMHVAMVAYQGKKMSKSLGNLVFVRGLVERHHAGAVRVLLNLHHYRAGWEYHEEAMTAAATLHHELSAAVNGGGLLEAAAFNEMSLAFYERLDDDLDTQGALSVLQLAAESVTQGTVTDATVSARTALTGLLDSLGIEPEAP